MGGEQFGVERTRSRAGSEPRRDRAVNNYGRALSPTEIERDEHRALIGGFWDEIGALQLEFMVREGGLRPEMRLLDVGCGCLRGGVHFIPYLEPANYYGIDSNRSLIEAGYRVELPRHGLEGRLARSRLLVADDFGAWRFGVAFDRAIAVSLWTHLPVADVGTSLRETARVLAPNGVMYASLFLRPAEHDPLRPLTHRPGEITTYPDRDPYHYAWEELRDVSFRLGLEAELIGEWSHPRAQQMARIRVPRPTGGASAKRPAPASSANPASTPSAETEAPMEDEPTAEVRPRLSVVVIAYEMQRELPRTIRSLSPAMQRGIDAADYELIVVDNGSSQPPDRSACEAFGAQIRWLRIDGAQPSPAAAINRGIAMARAPLVGVMIDGARLASPGMLRHALLAAELHPRPVIATLGFHLGPDLQPRAIERGYDQAAEDELLAGVDWTADGYRLFDVSVVAGSSRDGWFAPFLETNALFLPAAIWRELGGYDERFTSPGGGFVNVDIFARACELEDTRLVVLLGEATFHQVHGGVATSRPPLERRAFRSEYTRLTGRELRPPDVTPLYLGTPSPHALASLAATARAVGATADTG